MKTIEVSIDNVIYDFSYEIEEIKNGKNIIVTILDVNIQTLLGSPFIIGVMDSNVLVVDLYADDKANQMKGKIVEAILFKEKIDLI